MRIQILICVLVLLLFCLPVGICNAIDKYVPPISPPLTTSAAKTDDNLYLKVEGKIEEDFFIDNPKSIYLPITQRKLNVEIYKNYQQTHLLLYGYSHSKNGDYPINGEERYSGYNILGENIPNLRWPNDVGPKNIYLDDNSWISYPWENSVIKSWVRSRGEYLFHNMDLEPKPQWRNNIWWGLKLMRGSEFRGDENIPWEQYVHVLQPPTFWGWGWGIAWHDEHDGKGLLYRSIPIAPESMIIDWVPNLYVKNLNPGTPTEKDQAGNITYVAEPNTAYTATVTFGISEDSEWITTPPDNIPIFIGAAHQIKDSYSKILLTHSSGPGAVGGLKSAYPWGGIPGYKYQTIKYDTDKSEVVATFQWFAQPESRSLIVGINQWPGFQNLYEGDTGDEYNDNVVAVPLTIKELPDAYVQNIIPGTDKPEPDQAYNGTVTYGLQKDYPEPVVVKLGLTHNGWPVSGVDGQLVTFKPGETKSFPFVWHGQKLGQNSKLVAKIWPQQPTTKDINWGNNTKTVLLKNSIDLSIESLIPGSTTNYMVNETYTGSVVVKNNSPSTVTSVKVIFLKGKAEIPGTAFTIPSLGPNASVKVHFSWYSQATKGTYTLKARVNPDRTIPETNYADNETSSQVYINHNPQEVDGGQLHVTASASPTKLPAGWGFELNAATKTDRYIWYETVTHTRADGSSYTETVERTRICPGPRRVIAYFADGTHLELDSVKSGRPEENTWQLPPSNKTSDHLRKKYTSKYTPDGDFITRIVAEQAGDNGEFTAETYVTVRIEGGMYDNVNSRIIE